MVMIVLKFPTTESETVQVAILEKPRFSDALEKTLSDAYSVKIARLYAKQLGDFLFENMRYPENGIYQLHQKTQTFVVYSEKDNKWTDTNYGKDYYVITPTDVIWDCFNTTFRFLKNVSDSIKETIKNETLKMWNVETWDPVSSIEISTFEIFKMETDPFTKLIEDYFSSKRVTEIRTRIRNEFFHTNNDGYVILFNEGITNVTLLKDEVMQLNFEEPTTLMHSFEEELSEKMLKEFFSRLKNLFLYGVDVPYEIIRKEKNGIARVKYHRLDGVLFENELYLHSNALLEEEVVERAIIFYYFWGWNDFKNRYGDSLIIPSLNLKILFQNVSCFEEDFLADTILLFDDSGKNLPKKETAIFLGEDYDEIEVMKYNYRSCFDKYIHVELL